MPDRGIFIVFEGVEGSGKSTQLKLLAHYLKQKGQPVVTTREPGGTALGEELRKILLHRQDLQIHPLAEVLLFAAARTQHVAEVIKPSLDKGAIVLCDRFTPSTWCYQGYAGNCNCDLIEEINSKATLGINPDLVFIFDLEPEEGFRRKGTREDRFENKDLKFHRRLREAFRLWAKNHPSVAVVLDAANPPEELHQRIVAVLQQRFPNRFHT